MTPTSTPRWEGGGGEELGEGAVALVGLGFGEDNRGLVALSLLKWSKQRHRSS
jgi:hypothetical protein